MPDVQHASLRPGASSGIHVVQAWEAASATARTALSVGAADIGKVCRQLDDGSYWILTSVSGGATWRRIDGGGVALSNATPTPLGADASPGDAVDASRADHAHDVSALRLPLPTWIGNANGSSGWDAVPGELTEADVGRAALIDGTLHVLVGVGDGAQWVQLARVEEIPEALPLSDATPAVLTGTSTAGTPGVGTAAARDDHRHQLTTGWPVAVGAANAPGGSNALARADHVHDASGKADKHFGRVNPDGVFTVRPQDAGKLLYSSPDTTTDIRFPADATIPDGATYTVVHAGAYGKATLITADTGATIYAAGFGATTGGHVTSMTEQWSVATLIKLSANTWLLTGAV